MSMATKSNEFEKAVGRRKTATARVRVSLGKGTVTINGRDYKEYFGTDILRNKVIAPFTVIGKEGAYDATVKVEGGGPTGQADAVRHGISRALVEWNADFKPVLKAHGYMTRDSRAKERKKPGMKKARKVTQWRKR